MQQQGLANACVTDKCLRALLDSRHELRFDLGQCRRVRREDDRAEHALERVVCLVQAVEDAEEARRDVEVVLQDVLHARGVLEELDERAIHD